MSNSLAKSMRLKVIFTVLLCIALLVSLLPSGLQHAFAAEEATGKPNNLREQSVDSIDAMLEAGEHAEGEALAIIDNTTFVSRSFSPQSASLLDSAENLMDVSAKTYVEATGEPLALAHESFSAMSAFSPAKDDALSVVYVVSAEMSTRDLLISLQSDPRVIMVEPNYLYSTNTSALSPQDIAEVLSPEDTLDLTPYQWGCANTDEAAMTNGKQLGADMNPTLWDDHRTQSGYTNASGAVAIVDTGIDPTHPDLVNIVRDDMDTLTGVGGPHGYNGVTDDDPADTMDRNGHGTHCAGIVAAEWNDFGTSGVASGVELVAIKAQAADETIPTNAVVRGYNYLSLAIDNGLDLRAINNSWGGGGMTGILNVIVTTLGEKGAISVFASGNNSQNNDTHMDLSAAMQANPYLVSVNAETCAEARAEFSNWGRATTDVFAPGAIILSAVPLSNASYFPEAVSASSPASNIVYESFDSPRSAVTFYSGWDEEGTPIGSHSSQIYFDAYTSKNSWAIPFEEMDAKDEPERSDRYTTMKIQVDPLDFLDARYLGFHLYFSDETKYNIGRFYIAAVNDQGEEVFLQVKEGVSPDQWSGGRWKSFSIDLAALEEKFDSTIVLDDQNRLVVRMDLIRTEGAGFSPGEVAYIDAVGLGRDGAVIPYDYYSGTSMATPGVTGAAMVLSEMVDPTLAPGARARMLAAYVMGSVRPVSAFSELCTSGGALDLSYATAGEFTPVLQRANASVAGGDNIITVEGSFFGDAPGVVTVGGLEASIINWTDSMIVVSCPDALSSAAHEVTVTNDAGFIGKKTFLLDLASPPAKPATPLFEREYSMPVSGGEEQDILGGRLIGLGGYLYLLPESSMSDLEGCVHTIYRLDPATGEWTRCEDLPVPLFDVSATTFDGMLYVSGHIELDKGLNVQHMISYDPKTGSWSDRGEATVPLDSALYNFKGTLLSIGGRTTDEETGDQVVLNVVATYDPETQTYTPVGELAYALDAPLSVAARGDELFVGKELGSSLHLERLTWVNGALVATDISSTVPPFDESRYNSCAITTAKAGLLFSGTSALDADGELEDQDTYLSNIAAYGQDAPFEGINKRVSHAQLFWAATTAYNGQLYTFGSSYFEPSMFILRATAMETLPQAGDIEPTPDPGPTPTPKPTEKPSGSVSTGDSIPIAWVAVACVTVLVVLVRRKPHLD